MRNVKEEVNGRYTFNELLSSFDENHYQIQSFKKYTMAKTKDTSLRKGIAELLNKAPEPATSHTVENIPVDQIHPSKYNPRKTFDKAYIQELADSMKPPIGLLQPITLRKNDNGYEIAFGECRWRAAKLLKWATIPSLIKDIADDELLALQIIENLQREDVNPIDEAVAFKTLLKHEHIDWLVSRIHKTKKYIVDRLKLNELIPDAIDLVRSAILPIGHAVAISKLSFADQQKCLTKVIGHKFGHVDDERRYCNVAIEDLRDFIASDVMTDFDKISFDPADATLYEKAGACSDCPKRTCNNNLLFHDITKDDKCTDAACFHEKINLHVAREKERNKEQYGKVLSGERDQYNNGFIKVQGVSVKYSETPTKNTMPVVITKAERYNRNILGTTVYIDSKVLEATKTVKETSKQQKNGSNNITWEQRQREELKISWPIIETIDGMILPKIAIINEWLRNALDCINDRLLISFAAINELAGTEDMTTADEVFDKWNAIEGEGEESFEFKKVIIDDIIATYHMNEIIMILMLLKQVRDTDADPVDHTEQYGLSWKEMMDIINPTPPKKAAAKKSPK